jgi:outer membrane protein OmpA-like peptidoglycan-associated protein
MKTTSKLVVGMTVAMFTLPTWSSSSMANSQVWTTTNGSAVVDGNGNPVRTIHYIDKKVVVTNVTPKVSLSLLAVIQNAVAKVFNTETESELEPESEPKPKLLIIAEENNDLSPETPTPEPAPTVVEPEEIVVLEPVVKPVVIAVVAEEPKPEPQPEPKPQAKLEPKPEPAVEAVAPVIPAKIVYSFNNYKATILFDTDSAVITEDASGSLTQLAMATRQAERVLSVKLFGYADSRGDHDYNMALSAKRMLSVEEFLNGQSLSVTSRFAKGETSPILGPNGEDLSLSRRVDVSIKTRHLKD